MKILVVEIAALPLGYLGCYGNDWVATPNLDRLAAEGVVFDQHLADWPQAPGPLTWSQPSARSCWTGRYHFPGSGGTLPLALPWLPQTLASHAVPHQLLACLNLPNLSHEVLAAVTDLKRQPDWLLWVAGPSLAPPWQPAPDILEAYFPPDELQPWLGPPAGPLDMERDLERVQDTYAAMATTLDRQLGQLIGGLGDEGMLTEMCLVFTASCGLGLGEHGLLGGGGSWLHEELLHLPLLLRLPGAAQAGRRLSALTQPVDLPATLLDLLGLPLPSMHGHSLLPLAQGGQEIVREYAVAGLHCDAGLAWALRTPNWALLLPAANLPGRLFVKPDDRWEVNDVRQHHLELAEHMEKTLLAFIAATDQPGPLPQPPLGMPEPA